MSTNAPQLTLAQIHYADTAQWKTILRQALTDLRVAIPAIVKSFDANTQCVTVQIAVSELVRLNSPTWTEIDPVQNVPIVLPRAGGYSLTLPIEDGDEGLLVFSDTCFDLWWQNGGVQPPGGAPFTQPFHERRRHDVTDPFFIPGIWSQPNVLDNYSTDSAQLRSDDGNTIVDVAEDGLTLTSKKVTINSSGDVDINATGQVNIKSSGNNTEIDGTTYLLHTHTGVTTGGGTSGPVTPP